MKKITIGSLYNEDSRKELTITNKEAAAIIRMDSVIVHIPRINIAFNKMSLLWIEDDDDEKYFKSRTYFLQVSENKCVRCFVVSDKNLLKADDRYELLNNKPVEKEIASGGNFTVAGDPFIGPVTKRDYKKGSLIDDADITGKAQLTEHAFFYDLQPGVTEIMKKVHTDVDGTWIPSVYLDDSPDIQQALCIK